MAGCGVVTARHFPVGTGQDPAGNTDKQEDERKHGIDLFVVLLDLCLFLTHNVAFLLSWHLEGICYHRCENKERK